MPPLSFLIPQIDTLLLHISRMRPLSTGEIHVLAQSLRTLEVYNSNAIEGNTLTLGETKLVIEDGITIGGKTIREMHEATNLSLAIQRIVHTQEDISIQYIHDIHAMILRNIDDENAGIYRKIQVYISGDTRTLPPARDVDMQMSALIDWYIQHRDILHPVILSGQFHYRFVQIHPYIDGNGRTARMLSNIILLSRGYPIVILPVVRRGDYIQSLHSMTGSLDIFTQWYADIVHENLKDYIRMITP